MEIGSIVFQPALGVSNLLAPPVKNAVSNVTNGEVYAAPIDDKFADTAAFCEHYGIGLDVSANCVVVEAKRGEKPGTQHA